jgi:FkbH-like protein
VRVDQSTGGTVSDGNLIERLDRFVASRPQALAYGFIDDSGAEQRLSFLEIARQARAVAVKLREVCRPGDRALLIHPPGLEYVRAFLGCLHAGVVAVPAYPPDPSRLARMLPRLLAIVRDAKPSVVLSTRAIASMADALSGMAPELAGLPWIPTDDADDSRADAWQAPDLTSESVAFLQYTSGSTGDPKGVILTHGNLLHNIELQWAMLRGGGEERLVCWLPPYHDMGLIGGILALSMHGCPTTLMSPLTFLRNPLVWLQAITRQRATVAVAPNFAFELCVRKISPEERRALDLSSLNTVFNGAEPIRPETIERFLEAFGPRGFQREALVPCYGLAEATLIVTGIHARSREKDTLRVDADALQRGRVELREDGRELMTCGSPRDARVLIVDPEKLTPVPDGMVGEVWVSGRSVARGYWNREETTAQVFGARLANGDGPFLRTGDLGFMRDGELFFAGRRKDLIIVRGQNFYPQDLERTAEDAHPSLRKGCAAAFAVEVDGEERIAIAIEVERRWHDRRARRPSQPLAGERRASDRRQQAPDAGVAEDPEAFVPERVMDSIRTAITLAHGVRPYAVALLVAGSIPKTSSGKIQRFATKADFLNESLDLIGLWRDAGGSPHSTLDVEAFRAELVAAPEHERARIAIDRLRPWVASLLGVPADDIAPERPLVELGLDSMTAAQIGGALGPAITAELSLYELLRGATLANVAAIVGKNVASSSSGKAHIERTPPGEPLVLSVMQESQWLWDQLTTNPSAQNTPMAVRFEGELDAGVLERALVEIVRRHEVLRSSIKVVDGSPTLKIADVALALERRDLSEVPAEVRARALSSAMAEQTARPFDIATGALVRATLFCLSEREHVLFLNVHHIAIDAWSTDILLREIETLYGAFLGGEPSPLPPLPIQYADYARWHRAQLRDIEPKLEYWRGRLKEAPKSVELPTDRPRTPETASGPSERLTFQLSSELIDEIDALARKSGATRYMALLAGFSALLSRWSRRTDLLISTPHANRPHPDVDNLIGLFATPHLLRIDASKDPSFDELLTRARDEALAAHKNDLPLEVIVQDQRSARERRDVGFSNVMFNMLTRVGRQATLPGVKVEPLEPGGRIVDLDLQLEVEVSPAGARVVVEYKTSLFDRETAQALAAGYQAILEAATQSPHAALAHLPLPAELEDRARAARARDRRLSLAIAATFTAEPVEPALSFWFSELGIPADMRFARYNQVFQELLDERGLLSSNKDGVNVLLVRFEDWAGGGSLGPDPLERISKATSNFTAALRRAAGRAPTPYLVCLCPPSPEFPFGEEVAALEGQIAIEVRDIANVHVITSQDVARMYPVRDYYDVHADELGHLPYTREYLAALGTTIARRIYAMRSAPCKVLVLDCDNTLWSGIIGEDEVDGIVAKPGHLALHRFAVAQHDAGVLVCLASKNNEKDVWEAFDRHTSWPLKREHFITWRINWQPKSDNLRELAAELNLGLDSFMFIDDSPLECHEVRTNCPEVQVFQLPRESEKIPTFLGSIWSVDRLRITEEDRQRTKLYRQNLRREQLRRESMNLRQFVEGLELEVRIEPLRADQVARVSQLSHRTNQFNMTGRKRDEGEVTAMVGAEPPGPCCLTVDVRDRFGEYGLVGVLVYSEAGDQLEVDTFLLSCRVLGRGVEHEMLARLGAIASARGLKRVHIPFVRSKKNTPAMEFLQSVGILHKKGESLASEFSAEAASSTKYRVMEEPVTIAPENAARKSIIPKAGSIAPKKGMTLPPKSPTVIGSAQPIHQRIATELATVQDIVAAIEARRRRDRPQASAEYVGPRNDVERDLCELWAEVLGVKRVGVFDDFFELGGHSLMAMQAASRIRAMFNVDVSVRDFFESPTVATVAEAILTKQLELSAGVPGDLAALLDEVEALTQEEAQAALQGGSKSSR